MVQAVKTCLMSKSLQSKPVASARVRQIHDFSNFIRTSKVEESFGTYTGLKISSFTIFSDLVCVLKFQ